MHKAKLLIVEDDPNLLGGLRDILELDNYEVLTAENGRQGLEVLKTLGDRPPDLIVSDIMMPHMDGMEFLRAVRLQNHWIKIPFIFLTAKGEKTDIQQGKVLGVDDYLTKPFDADDLLIAIDAKLQRHKKINEVQADAITELKRNILTILNHELRTPLTLVIAYADMLKDFDQATLNGQDLLEFLRGINAGAERLRRLIENFILLVELETGDMQRTFDWRKQEINDLDTALRAALYQVPQESSQNRHVVFEIAPNLPSFIGDQELIGVAIRELLDNALKFSPKDKIVRAGATAHDDSICISVCDEGRGIPPHEIPRIWEFFYQVDRDIYENQGSGSGLALVRALMELHQGRIEVESEVGKGSCFRLYFPL
ncbi:MAG: hybrid sensor histidine kinase/response regulator [Anaerolineae bacterium]|jgi:signal transduction histidine kinase|nr:hybrid sensor histidine kinase/response regulator [Anaerolineae bacterium]